MISDLEIGLPTYAPGPSYLASGWLDVRFAPALAPSHTSLAQAISPLAGWMCASRRLSNFEIPNPKSISLPAATGLQRWRGGG